MLHLFQSMASLKINFDNSKIMMIIEDSVKIELYADIWTITSGHGQWNILVIQWVGLD
jgi:hypothetical protein